MILRRIIKQSGLPVEVVLDFALELLDIASRRLAPSPINRQAVGLEPRDGATLGHRSAARLCRGCPSSVGQAPPQRSGRRGSNEEVDCSVCQPQGIMVYRLYAS